MKIDDFKTLESIRAGIMKDLDDLPPGKQLSTVEMVEYLMAKSGATPETKFLSKLLYDAVRNRPYATFPGYTTPGTPRLSTKGFSRGKMVTPVLWHRANSGSCPHCGGNGRVALDKAPGSPISDETPLGGLK